jgi:hypothetical protein
MPALPACTTVLAAPVVEPTVTVLALAPVPILTAPVELESSETALVPPEVIATAAVPVILPMLTKLPLTSIRFVLFVWIVLALAVVAVTVPVVVKLPAVAVPLMFKCPVWGLPVVACRFTYGPPLPAPSIFVGFHALPFQMYDCEAPFATATLYIVKLVVPMFEM